MENGQQIRRADPTTIQNKFLVGYQGWFTCAGDGPPIGPGHHGWLHWLSHPLPDGGKPNFDFWPDLSSYDSSELLPCPGLTLPDVTQAKLFSSRHPQTVRRHFNWMARCGVDGAFLQRFACEVDEGDTGMRRVRDQVLDNVRKAAEAEGRVWAIMYDVNGFPAEKVESAIRSDWEHLVHDLRILDSPNYLQEHGRPVLAIWGLGFEHLHHNPHSVRSLLGHLRLSIPSGLYLFGGLPTHWQTLEGDQTPDPEFLEIWYNQLDAISPWTIGRFGDEGGVDWYAEQKIRKDLAALKERAERTGRKVDYVPVVWPGGSCKNRDVESGGGTLNQPPRIGGKFLWQQIHNAVREGCRTIYGAMWDEYDEGTALMPIVSSKREVPTSDDGRFRFIALDIDGHDLPSDWFMRICGMASEGLKGERRILDTFPIKELQDFWSTRPRYQDQEQGSSAPEDLPPPPPYSLEPSTSSAPVPAPVAPAATRPETAPTMFQSPPQQAYGQPSGYGQSSGSTHAQGYAPVPNAASYPIRHDTSSSTSSYAPTVPSSSRPPNDPYRQQSYTSHGPYGQQQSAYAPPVPSPGTRLHDLRQDPYGVGALTHDMQQHAPFAPAQGQPHLPSQSSPPPQAQFPQGPSSASPPAQWPPTDWNQPSPQQQYQNQGYFAQSSAPYGGSSGTYGAPGTLQPAPNLPPRPSSTTPSTPPAPHASHGSSSAPARPAGVDFALNTIDRFAGSERRKQVEKRVESVTKSVDTVTQLGSKLYGRFMK